MSKIELIKELRALTQAPMQDCKNALIEASDDMQKAIDIIKTKGKNITCSTKISSEGRVITSHLDDKTVQMLEVNCITDFVANSKEFADFCQLASQSLTETTKNNFPWKPETSLPLEEARKNLISITKENIVIRRWWVEQLFPDGKVFSYVHPNAENAKIGVVLSLLASSKEIAGSPQFNKLGNDLVLQIAAMSPLAVSPDKLDPTLVARQRAIFNEQIAALNKPLVATTKILDGKMNKWWTEVTLLNQESVLYPKTSIEQLIKNVSSELGGIVQVINFIRCQVGEGLDKPQENLELEAAKLIQVVDNS